MEVLVRLLFARHQGKTAARMISNSQLVELCNQVFRTQVCVTLEHLHGLVATDCRNFLIAQTTLDKATYGLMPEVVKPEVRTTD